MGQEAIKRSDFAFALLRARKEAGMSQTELGNILKRTKQTVGAYERGEIVPDERTARQLAEVLPVKPDFQRMWGAARIAHLDEINRRARSHVEKVAGLRRSAVVS